MASPGVDDFIKPATLETFSKIMRLLFYVFCSPQTGFGHFYRSMALAQVASDRGHTVYIASDTRPSNNVIWLSVKYDFPPSLEYALDFVKPDWLIVDLPDTLPAWIEDMATCKICVLNGIGYDQANNVALRVIQGVGDLELPKGVDLSNTVMGVDYVIIRPEIERFKKCTKNNKIFVWAGGNDVTGLLPRYEQVCSDWVSTLIVSNITPVPGATGQNHTVIKPQSSLDIFKWLASSKRAVVNMGMIVWEALFLGIKVHCFNASKLHLTFSQAMDRQGLLKSYPAVGLPDNEQMRKFLEQDFEIKGKRPDLKGGERVIKEMERR